MAQNRASKDLKTKIAWISIIWAFKTSTVCTQTHQIKKLLMEKTSKLTQCSCRLTERPQVITMCRWASTRDTHSNNFSSTILWRTVRIVTSILFLICRLARWFSQSICRRNSILFHRLIIYPCRSCNNTTLTCNPLILLLFQWPVQSKTKKAKSILNNNSIQKFKILKT